MLDPQKLFENFFDDIRITTTRLYDFAIDCINRLTAANGIATKYQGLIDLLTPLAEAVGKELGDVDTGLNIQKGSTLTVDDFIAGFKTTMSAKEGVIADALGGRNTPAYLEFYPHGITEYRSATKTTMPALVDRLNTAATAHATELGTTLTALLQGFETTYNDARNNQQQQKGNVGDNRSQRTTARADLEIGLVTAVHSIGEMYPGNVQQCMSFFSFNMLNPATKKKHVSFDGVLAAAATAQVFNLTLSASNTLTIINPDDNAPFSVYFSATPNGTPTPKAKQVQPGQTLVVKPGDLGDAGSTFLLIQNLSDVNEGAYQVTLTGPAAGNSK